MPPVAAAILELAKTQTVFLGVWPLLVVVELTKNVRGQRRIEVVSDANTPAPAARRATLAYGAQRDEPRNGLSSFGDHDLFTRLGAINQLGKACFRLVDVDVLRHWRSPGN
jgi:hypothetical protein